MYNFYLNKLFILLKEIIMIIKTHIKLILNIYNLFSKYYCRERERERERERDNLLCMENEREKEREITFCV